MSIIRAVAIPGTGGEVQGRRSTPWKTIRPPRRNQDISF